MSQSYPKSLGAGSDKYGLCEVCNKKMDTAYISYVYWPNRSVAVFSHKECVIDEIKKPCKQVGCFLEPPCPDCGSSLIDFPVGA